MLCALAASWFNFSISMQIVDSGRYSLVPRVLIFITQGEGSELRVLLQQGAPHKRLWANLYNGVGGHVERGEDLLSAARRELAEETGVQIDQLIPPGLWLCGTLIVDTGSNPGIGLSVWRGQLHPQLGYAQMPVSPEGSLHWVDPALIAELPCLPDLPGLLPQVLAQTPSLPPFSAFSDGGEPPQIVFG
jgi:8-oxo-dGTP diphosphatase